MKRLSVIVMFLFLPVFLYGEELQGIGYGSTTEEAKEEALADLSSAIKVQVFFQNMSRQL